MQRARAPNLRARTWIGNFDGMLNPRCAAYDFYHFRIGEIYLQGPLFPGMTAAVSGHPPTIGCASSWSIISIYRIVSGTTTTAARVQLQKQPVWSEFVARMVLAGMHGAN